MLWALKTPKPQFHKWAELAYLKMIAAQSPSELYIVNVVDIIMVGWESSFQVSGFIGLGISQAFVLCRRSLNELHVLCYY